MARTLSLVLMCVLLFSTIGMALGGNIAYSQEQAGGNPTNDTVPVSRTYTYNYQKEACPPYYPCETTTISERFSGSATLVHVDGGYEGFGSGSYSYTNDLVRSPYQNCPDRDSSHLAYNGEADMIVHYQFSIDNDVTGGPDTSMYNSTYGVVEVLVEDDDLHVESSSRTCAETASWSSDDGRVDLNCHLPLKPEGLSLVNIGPRPMRQLTTF